MKHVYLAGPIQGCDWAGANDWRIKISEELYKAGIQGISPLRCEPLVGETYNAQYTDPRFGTARAIGSKNVYDVRTCDMCLIYLPKPEEGRHQSYGTIIEMAWAHIIGTPTVVVSDDPDILSHPVISTCASWLLESLEDALEVMTGVLGGYHGYGKNV